MKALANSPDQRFSTARDLQLALEEFARARQLRSSSVGLSEYMTSLFPSQVGEWDLAQRSGQSLIEYVTSMLATRMTSSGVTRGDDRSWFKRWAPAIALLALGAAVAGWVVAFQRTEPASVRDNKSVVQPANQPTTAGGQPTSGTSGKKAAPVPEPVVKTDDEIDAAVIEIDAASGGADPVVQPIKKRPPRPARPPTPPTPNTGGSAAPPNTPPGLDDRLNPFKPPDKPK
jgi:hypothetical protein